MDSKENILKNYSCIYPFEYVDIQTNGMYMCCPAWNDTNIQIDDDVKKSWFSEKANDIRESILDGSYSYCDKVNCPSLSRMLNQSINYVASNLPPNFIPKPDLIKKYNVDNFQSTPHEILFGFDRSCNFKCPSCRKGLIPNDDENSPEHKKKLLQLYSIEQQFAQTAKKIIITGSGDPFYSKIYRDYLINFDASLYPNLEDIHIVTNGSMLNETMWNMIKKATPFIKTIEVSIDAGTKDTYENKTRLNGNWDILMDSLKFLSTIKSVNTCIFSMTVSKHNYKEMLDMYNILYPMFKHKNILNINYRRLVQWGTYDTTTYNDLCIFEKEHELYLDFVKELKKIERLDKVYTNFEDILAENTTKKGLI
jgi:hypothetical protein